MISIIICSYQKLVLEKALESVENTIGVAYEIIAVDNTAGNSGICKAYNTAAVKAKFDILCFMHEDIEFETNNWGQNVIRHLADKEIGLIGVAGGDTKSRVPSGWASMTFSSEINMVQHYKYKEKVPHAIFETAYPESISICKRVACTDGLWMCTRKDVFKKYKFDETTFSGFHGYDIDYSLQVNTEYKVCVVFDVLIHHYSEGVLGIEWLESAVKLSEKWKKLLPFSVRDITKKELIRQHWTTMGVFIDSMAGLKYTSSVIFYRLIRYSGNRFFHLKHFLHFFKRVLLKVKSK
jgi:glycosyltransferase involved in cell wall biosynthesis